MRPPRPAGEKRRAYLVGVAHPAYTAEVELAPEALASLSEDVA